MKKYIQKLLKRVYLYTKLMYKYDANKYQPIDFLKNKKKRINLEKAPLILFCFWTGYNKMSDNRKECLKSIYENTNVEVKFITPENLDHYILPKQPLHKSYQYLSNVHKSDYLRCYFMYHYGGGYTDIKYHKNSWLNAFKRLNENTKYSILGANEENNTKDNIGYIENFFDSETTKSINEDMEKYFLYLISNCSYIFKPKSNFAYDWLNELHRRMDYLYDDLVKNPGNIMGDNENYPIPWTAILGQIFHPLCLKYHQEILHDNSIKPNYTNYR